MPDDADKVCSSVLSPDPPDVQQFTFLLTLHPEYVLIFCECRHTEVSTNLIESIFTVLHDAVYLYTRPV